ncbi:hypothetical protein [Candidatus Ruminimicrobiellum ovillum]|uniref:hypothetical protein n=1 Tax=Candidatus Ruminimicrobiellum ovillum TaxID=1947927 RepID=UPI003559BFF8
MKRNIIILSVLSFLFSAVLMYLFAEILYKERISVQIKSAQESIVSGIELIAPEIKASLTKVDDISLLYSIEKLSKIKSVQESFIIDSDLNILIHDNSEKWNKKYDQDFYRELVKIKEVAVRNIDSYTMVYSLPLNETSSLCVKFSLQSIYDSLKLWKIKLYVYGFIVSLLFAFAVYYLSKFLFLRPFNKAKKYLSVNNTTKKTIYYDIVKMALSYSGNADENDENSLLKLKNFMNVLCKSYLSYSDEIFVVLDSNARLIYCSDDNNVVLDEKTVGEHIVKLTRNSEILKSVSTLLENPSDVINIDISAYKINLTPVKDEQDDFVGIIISGNTRKDTF